MDPSRRQTPNPGVAHWFLLGLLLNPAWSSASEPAEQATPNGHPTTAPDLAQATPDQTATPEAGPKPATRRAELTAKVDQAARAHGLDRDLAHALIRAESAYNSQAVSSAGAIGLMQVMPETAADYGVKNPDTLFETDTNLNTGMRHFKRLLAKYGNIGSAVMAYNAGEGALERSGGFVTYAETQRYTHQVLTTYLVSKGIAPYSPQARDATGINLTPAMARAKGGGGVTSHRNQLETDKPETNSVWLSTAIRPELNTNLSAQLRNNPRRLSTRLSSPQPLKVSRLRVTPPRYAARPSNKIITRNR